MLYWLASCQVFAGAGCHEQLRGESPFAAWVIPWSADTGDLRLRRRRPGHPTHYSRRTEKAYLDWIRRFLELHHGTHPREMAESDARRSTMVKDVLEERK
jgi:hypothetical protein